MNAKLLIPAIKFLTLDLGFLQKEHTGSFSSNCIIFAVILFWHLATDSNRNLTDLETVVLPLHQRDIK